MFTFIQLIMYFGVVVVGLLYYVFSYSRGRQNQGEENTLRENDSTNDEKLNKLIIGLGNPGAFYEKMRHNVGQIVLKKLAEHFHVELKNVSDGSIAVIVIGGIKIGIFLPNCYMNRSGIPVKRVVDKYLGSNIENMIIVHDDLDNSFGKVKVKVGGSAEGHNGVKSIIEQLGSKEFNRLKIGIDRPISKDKLIVGPYVLGQFPGEQLKELENSILKKVIDILKEKTYL